MMSTITNSNRVNVPAVCRIVESSGARTGATRGTGVLVSPGLLLTSRLAVGSKESAATMSAMFFEGTKKRTVEVRLLPERHYFAAAFPEYMDYCLVACESTPVANVAPVLVPLVKKAWVPVNEGDVVLIVQHLISRSTEDDGGEVTGHDKAGPLHVGTHSSVVAAPEDVEQKRFEEVLRCRGDLYFLQTDGLKRSAGCPVFNDEGCLVGLQSQQRGADGEGLVNRVLSIVAIVKHMFTNKQLSFFLQGNAGGPSFDELWDTWFTERDLSRVCAILANFKGREIVREVTRRLCELTANSSPATTALEDSGVVSIVLSNLLLFPKDEELAELGLRALWNVSVGSDKALQAIAANDGVETVMKVVECFPLSESIVQFGSVVLCNLADASPTALQESRVGERLLAVLLPALTHYRDSAVLQKFGLAILTRLLRRDGASSMPSAAQASAFAVVMVRAGMLEHVGYLLHRFEQGQVFLVEKILQFVAELAQNREAVAMSQDSLASAPGGSGASGEDLTRKVGYLTTELIDTLVAVMKHNVGSDPVMASGNTALWGLGNVPEYRAAILLNPDSQEVLRLSIPSLLASRR